MIKQFVSITVGLLLLLTVLPVIAEPDGTISSALVFKNVVGSKNSNYPPVTPSTPKGPNAAGPGIPVDFITTTVDPDGDQLFYLWDWGDGNMTDWLGPFSSNVSTTANYTWYFNGNYSIRVKAKDSNNNESNWSEAHVISIGPQIDIINPKSGFIYLLLPAFNNSFFYSAIFDGLGICILFTTQKLQIQANGTAAVKKVQFIIVDQQTGDIIQVNDTNASDGFSYSLDVFRGLFSLSIFAYDGNNTLIDWYVLPYILFLRFNSGSSHLSKRVSSRGTNHLLHH
jgi:hypothetical protein